MTEQDAAEQLADALGLEPGDTVRVRTPQFERADDIEPGEAPLTHGALDRLTEADEATLTDLGLQKWSDDSRVWLLPWEWHDQIPGDYPLTDIFGEQSSRADLPAEPDKRFGALSVGIVPAFEQERDSR